MKVISYKSLPTQMPINLTIVSWLLLDRLQASDWVWGVVGTILTLLWVFCLISIFTSEYVDIFKNK